MALGGILGNGTFIAYSANSPHVWTKLGQLSDVTFFTYVSDDVNIDTHSRTNKLHKTMPGLITVSNITAVVLSDLNPSTSADQAAMRSYNATGTAIWIRIEAPVNRERTSFMGVELLCSVKSYQPTTPIGDVQKTTIELQFNGDDVYWDAAAGASEF